MALELWTSGELYEIVTDDRMDPIPSLILDTYFTETFYSSDSEIRVSELPAAYRVLAPFALPSEQGKPIFKTRGEKLKSFLPPYIKPKDAVRPQDAMTRRPSEILGNQQITLQDRFENRLKEVQDFHVRAIKMQETWMAARAFIDGKVTIKYDRVQGAAFPEVIIDFGRDAGHTIVLNTSFWSDPAHPILDNVQAWANTMRRATRGGFPRQLWLGADVAPYFNKNTQVIAEMTNQRRGTQVDVKTGIISYEEPLTYLGTVGAGIDVFVYKDEVENNDGTIVDLLSPKDVVLVAPGARGIRAYGAIYNAKAMSEATPTDIFPSMWEENDPSVVFLMNESSPLPIPMRPNATLKATVLA